MGDLNRKEKHFYCEGNPRVEGVSRVRRGVSIAGGTGAALGRRLHLTPLEPGLRQGVSRGPCPPHPSRDRSPSKRDAQSPVGETRAAAIPPQTAFSESSQNYDGQTSNVRIPNQRSIYTRTDYSLLDLWDWYPILNPISRSIWVLVSITAAEEGKFGSYPFRPMPGAGRGDCWRTNTSVPSCWERTSHLTR